MGEMDSAVDPPRHEPSKTPALVSLMPSCLSQASIPCATESASHLPTLDVDHFEGSLENVLRDVEHRAETNRAFAAPDGQQPALEHPAVKLLTCVTIGQIEGDHQSASPH